MPPLSWKRLCNARTMGEMLSRKPVRHILDELVERTRGTMHEHSLVLRSMAGPTDRHVVEAGPIREGEMKSCRIAYDESALCYIHTHPSVGCAGAVAPSPTDLERARDYVASAAYHIVINCAKEGTICTYTANPLCRIPTSKEWNAALVKREPASDISKVFDSIRNGHDVTLRPRYLGAIERAMREWGFPATVASYTTTPVEGIVLPDNEDLLEQRILDENSW